MKDKKSLIVNILHYKDIKYESINEYIKFISSDRKMRINNFKFEKDKVSSLLTGLFARCLISDYLGIPVSVLEFGKGEYGKPFLKNNTECHFSISHTDNYSVVAVDDLSVGVDIEIIVNKKLDIKEISNMFFSEKEKLILRRSDYSPNVFFEIWTAKESYIKMTGEGLSKPLDSFDFNNINKGYKIFTNQIEDASLSVCCRENIEKLNYIYWDVDEILKRIII